jgi:hypothetical protein
MSLRRSLAVIPAEVSYDLEHRSTEMRLLSRDSITRTFDVRKHAVDPLQMQEDMLSHPRHC